MKELISKLTWADYVALLALLRGLYVGYKSGFFQELLRVAGYVLTLLITLQVHELVAQQLTLRTFLNESSAKMISFAAVLVAVYAGIKVVRTIVVKALKLAEGGTVQRVLGAGVGGARLLVLLSFFFMLIDSTPLKELKTDVHSRSLTGPAIAEVAPTLYDFVENFSDGISLSGQPARS